MTAEAAAVAEAEAAAAAEVACCLRSRSSCHWIAPTMPCDACAEQQMRAGERERESINGQGLRLEQQRQRQRQQQQQQQAGLRSVGSVRVREINKLPVHYQSNTGNSCFSFILL